MFYMMFTEWDIQTFTERQQTDRLTRQAEWVQDKSLPSNGALNAENEIITCTFKVDMWPSFDIALLFWKLNFQKKFVSPYFAIKCFNGLDDEVLWE